jgi:hypothetical protein
MAPKRAPTKPARLQKRITPAVPMVNRGQEKLSFSDAPAKASSNGHYTM